MKRNFYLLVMTKYFSDRIKENTDALKSYCIDYADYTCTILEAIGKIRVRQMTGCVLGAETEPFNIALKQAIDSRQEFFFCNKVGLVSDQIVSDCLCNSIDYAIVNAVCE